MVFDKTLWRHLIHVATSWDKAWLLLLYILLIESCNWEALRLQVFDV